MAETGTHDTNPPVARFAAPAPIDNVYRPRHLTD